jgi:two-component system, OmpR family, response regulator QseB
VINVLIVEDDDDLAALFEAGLARHGFAVTIASSCAAAQEATLERVFAAVVTDVSLPDGSGYDLIAALTPRPRALVVMSGFEVDENEAKGTIADVRLVKPVDVDSLAQKLNALLARADSSSK